MRLGKSTGSAIGRRAVLKGSSAALGLVAGAGAVRGFPTIWAQNIKDVVVNHAGPPVTAIPRIAEQASKDLGFTVHMQTTENADLLNRFLSQSSSIDCADVSISVPPGSTFEGHKKPPCSSRLVNRQRPVPSQ